MIFVLTGVAVDRLVDSLKGRAVQSMERFINTELPAFVLRVIVVMLAHLMQEES